MNAPHAPKTSGPANVGEAFAAQVLAHPDRDAVTIHRVGQPPRARSYTELDRAARSRAAALDARLPRGSRVVIALPSSLEFAEAYLACLMSGMTAVPLPPLGGSNRSTDRIEAVVRDCAPGLILTAPEDLGTAAEWAKERGGGGPIEAVVPIDPGEPTSSWTPPAVAPQTPAVLQYSSGSTGTPKGVVLSHRNVLANTRAQYVDLGLTGEDRLGSWIPMHHDMGLFFQLTTPVTHGLSCVLMPPVEFLKRPVEWLRMLDRYRITATSAPNFALDVCRRVVTDAQLAELDLSRVRWVFNGSEPIHAPTQSAFSARFAAAGLREGAVSPAYGLAEATVFVCARSQDVAATVLPVDAAQLERGELEPAVNGSQLVGVGYPRSLEMRVVDPATRRVLPAGRVGELWLRGESIGAGYWAGPPRAPRSSRPGSPMRRRTTAAGCARAISPRCARVSSSSPAVSRR